MSKNKKRNKEKGKELLGKVGPTEEKIWNVVFTVLGILCFFSFFFLITIFITKNNADKEAEEADKNKAGATISYEEIVLGRSLSMEDGDYLVIFYDKSDKDISSTYASLVSSYKNKADKLGIYTVDMSKPFNSSFTTTGESNKNPTKADQFLINGPTLIKVSSKAVSMYIEGEEAITDYLK